MGQRRRPHLPPHHRVDANYLFTIKDEVANAGAAPVTLYPYALISRHGTPQVLGFYILHEGLVGVLGDKGLQEVTYSSIEDKKAIEFNVTNAWLGITDKYWAATLLPATDAHAEGALLDQPGRQHPQAYQTDYLLDARTVAPGATGDRRRAAVRRRQGNRADRRLRKTAQAQPLRPADRLGLVLLHHQAGVPG